MSEENLVLEERDGHVQILKLNRPERHHALNRGLTTALADALTRADQDDDVHVIVLTGTGEKAFCAGADMLELSGVEDTSTEVERAQPTGAAGNAFAAIHKTEVPIIAAINGYCYGGGAQLAIACDILLASDNATFRLPGAEYGLVVAASILPRLVGSSKAKELILTARKFDAAEAFSWGMLSDVVSQTELMGKAIDLAQEIAKNSVSAVKASKAVIDKATRSDEADALELSINHELRGSPEQTERFRSATKRVTGR